MHCFCCLSKGSRLTHPAPALLMIKGLRMLVVKGFSAPDAPGGMQWSQLEWHILRNHVYCTNLIQKGQLGYLWKFLYTCKRYELIERECAQGTSYLQAPEQQQRELIKKDLSVEDCG
eukprot:scaffold36754_cov17-Tisochrysis_lutea.AAC.1